MRQPTLQYMFNFPPRYFILLLNRPVRIWLGYNVLYWQKTILGDHIIILNSHFRPLEPLRGRPVSDYDLSCANDLAILLI